MAITWFRNKSIRFKINLLVLTFIALMVALGVVLIVISYRSLQTELLNRGQVIVRRLAESHSYQVSLGLADELKPIINKLMQEEGIRYVEFIDPDGNIIQTGDGQYKAQSDPAHRPADYSRFILDSLLRRPEGARVLGKDGVELYDFHAQVEVTASTQNGALQKRTIGVVRMAMEPNTLDAVATD